MGSRDLEIAAALRVPKIITLALTMGLIGFGVLSAVIPWGPSPEPDGQRILIGILCLFAIPEVVACMIIRRGIIVQAQRRHEGEAASADLALGLVPTLTTLTIIGAAMAEGFGIFGITVYALTDNAPVLIAPGVAILALAL
ncbi:MAG: hypothetical protein GY842_12570, partial [bacterium]|nr:hypothetical protein [bacterium]